MNRQSGPPPLMSLPMLNYNQFFTPADTKNTDQSRRQNEGMRPGDDMFHNGSRDYRYNDRRQQGGRQAQRQNAIEMQLVKALQKPVDSGRGESMMKKMGWSGGGLGRSGEGIVEPIAPNAAYVSEPRLRNYGTGNLSGAATRRLRRLVKANIPSEKAIHLCRLPYKQLLEEARLTKLLDAQENQNQTVNSDGSLNVCIYNKTLMTEEQMESLHRALKQAILKITTKGVGPKFTGLIHKKGWVLVKCQDEMSKNWLSEVITHLEPWPEAQLTIKDDGDVPMGVMVTVYIPHDEAKSIDEALHLLRVQNAGLNTESWRVFNGKKVDNGLVVAFSIDDGSLETLKANDLKATLGFKTIHFKVKDATDPFMTSVKNWFDCGHPQESDKSEGSSQNRPGPIRGFNRGRFENSRGRVGDNRERIVNSRDRTGASFGENRRQTNDNPPVGQFGPRRGQFGGKRGQFGDNRGQFGGNRGQFGSNRGQFGGNRGSNEFRRGGRGVNRGRMGAARFT